MLQLHKLHCTIENNFNHNCIFFLHTILGPALRDTAHNAEHVIRSIDWRWQWHHRKRLAAAGLLTIESCTCQDTTQGQGEREPMSWHPAAWYSLTDSAPYYSLSLTCWRSQVFLNFEVLHSEFLWVASLWS